MKVLLLLAYVSAITAVTFFYSCKSTDQDEMKAIDSLPIEIKSVQTDAVYLTS